MADETRPGSPMGASATKHTPSANWSQTCPATSRPNRVLPAPPGPVSVRTRTSGSINRCLTASTSRSLPMKGVSGDGRSEGQATRAAEPAGGRADVSKRLRSDRESPKASARLCTVYLWGRRCSPRSRRLMVSTLSPERSAKSSCVSPTAFRCRRRRSPKARCSPEFNTRSPSRACSGTLANTGSCRCAP